MHAPPGPTASMSVTSSSSSASSSSSSISSPSPLLRLASHNLSPRPTTPGHLGRSASLPLEHHGGPATTAPLPRLTDLYDLQHVIGQGAYGVVWLALDRRSGQRVAVKKIADVFGDSKEAKRTLREVRLMRHFRGSSPHILAIHDLVPAMAEGKEEGEEEAVTMHNFRDLYVVTEFMDGGDLSQLTCGNKPPPEAAAHSGWHRPDEQLVKAVAFGLLSGLRVIHAARVLHRDLRPKNLLLSGDTVKIADFGMGRGKAKKLETAQNRMKLSLMEFVSNRYYTAPEGLLPNNEYSYPVDVWAVGCIVTEMLLGRNVFRDSRYPDQMRTVISVLGTPAEEDLASIASGRNEKFRAYIRTLQAHEPNRLWTLLPNLSAEGKDFLQRLLMFNPNKRATAQEALRHPWLRDVAAAHTSAPGSTADDGDDEPGDHGVVAPFEGGDIEAADDESALRPLLWREALSYRGRD